MRAQDGAFGARASLLDAGWMRDALLSDAVRGAFRRSKAADQPALTPLTLAMG